MPMRTRPQATSTVPQTKLNTLADIIATCVNTTSNTSSACSTLFTATPNAAGTKPATTFDAVLNLAQNPTINSTNTGLINQPTAVSPFLPYLSANPNDWTVSVKYTAPNASGPARPDVDASGNVWIPNLTGNSLTELSTRGAVLSGASGFTGGGLNQPESIAVDRTAGAVWVNNFGSGQVSRFSTGGAADSASPYATGNGNWIQRAARSEQTPGRGLQRHLPTHFKRQRLRVVGHHDSNQLQQQSRSQPQRRSLDHPVPGELLIQAGGYRLYAFHLRRGRLKQPRWPRQRLQRQPLDR